LHGIPILLKQLIIAQQILFPLSLSIGSLIIFVEIVGKVDKISSFYIKS